MRILWHTISYFISIYLAMDGEVLIATISPLFMVIHCNQREKQRDRGRERERQVGRERFFRMYGKKSEEMIPQQKWNKSIVTNTARNENVLLHRKFEYMMRKRRISFFFFFCTLCPSIVHSHYVCVCGDENDVMPFNSQKM